MPLWDHLFGAFAAVFAFKNLILMTVGVVAGLIAGAIPGFHDRDGDRSHIALHLWHAAGGRPVDHAGGICRRPVGRTNVGNPHRHSGYAVGRRHNVRWLYHGARRQARFSAWNRRVVIFLRRAVECHSAVFVGAATRPHRARIRALGLLLAGCLRANHRRQPFRRGPAQRPHFGRLRNPGRQFRRGPDQWRGPIHLRHRRARARLRLSPGAGRAVRLQSIDVRRTRSRHGDRGPGGAGRSQRQDRAPESHQGHRRMLGGLAALLADRRFCRRAAGRRQLDLEHSRLRSGQEGLQIS